jgi:hypothetical protein
MIFELSAQSSDIQDRDRWRACSRTRALLAVILDLVIALRPGFKITSVDLVSEETGYAIPAALQSLRPGRLLGLGHWIARQQPGLDGVRES